MTEKTRIFLAHAREDKEQVRKLYADLKDQGFEPWLDEEDFLGGQIWKIEFPKAINSARIFLACLASRSIEKVGYVQNEFRQALAQYANHPPESIFLIPVRLDDCEIPNLEIPDRGMSLRDFHWIDLWEARGFERLTRSLRNAIPDGSATKKKPTAPNKFEPLSIFQDIEEPWCPKMVVIPAGSFLMGSPEDKSNCESVTRPNMQLWGSKAALAIGFDATSRARIVGASAHDACQCRS